MTTSRESLWAVAPADRPREKLERLGAAALSDAELVALVLGSGLPGVNVLDNAASLLAQAGGVQELMVMTVRELKALMGVGVATAGRVVAVSELWRRAHDPLPGAQIEHPADIVDVVRAFLATRASPARHPAAADTGASLFRAGDDGGGGRDDPVSAPEPGTYLVVADDELRVRVVVPLARDVGEGIRSLVPRVLHEVLYRGGTAFALVEARPRAPDCGDDSDLRAIRDVLRLASATVGLRFLSTVVVSPDSWWLID